jgi:hypothetical protein
MNSLVTMGMFPDYKPGRGGGGGAPPYHMGEDPEKKKPIIQIVKLTEKAIMSEQINKLTVKLTEI